VGKPSSLGGCKGRNAVTKYLGRRETRRRGRFEAAADAAVARQWSPDAVTAEATRRLETVLGAARTAQHYRERLSADRTLAPFDALEGLPVLSRAELRRDFGRFLSDLQGKVRLAYSAGTGGERTQTVHPLSTQLDREVAERRWYEGLGLPPHIVEVDVFPWPGVGREAKARHDPRVRYVELGAGDVAEAFGRGASLGELLVAQPDVLSFLRGAGRWPSVAWIASSFEVLRPETRQELDEVDAPPLAETYSTSELTAAVAFTYAGCRGMHASADVIHVEIVDADGTQLAPGLVGRIVVSDLGNTAMPLLRYELGDLGLLEPPETCPCGRALPLVRVLGRALAELGAPTQRLPASAVIERLSDVIPAPFVLDRRAPARFVVVTRASFDEDRARAELEHTVGSCTLERAEPDPQLERALAAGSFAVDTTTRHPLRQYLHGPAPRGWQPHPRFAPVTPVVAGEHYPASDSPRGLDRSTARRLLRAAYARTSPESLVRVLDSGSMWPLLLRETMVRVRWGVPDVAKTRPGDVLLLEGALGLPVVHRVAAVDARHEPPVILQVGDAYDLGDPYAGYWLPFDSVLGRVVGIEEPGGVELALTTRFARGAGRVVALTTRALWRADRSRLRSVLAPPTLLLQRGAGRAAAAALRAAARRRARARAAAQ
jgi:hypothetical protein